MAGAVAPLFMMGMGQDGDSADVDPRTQMMRAMLLKQMQGGGQGGQPGTSSVADHGPEGESGGEVGSRHIDKGTTQPYYATDSAMSQAGGQLPGFDHTTGLPTEFPSTATKDAAYSRLQKAEAAPEVQPMSKGQRILRSVAPLIPIAGPAIIGQENVARHRGMQDVENARQDYHTEATLEQSQRDQALREKIAMQNLEVTKAMKQLLITSGERNTDVRAGVGHERNVVSGAKSGYEVGYGPDGQEHVTPMSTDDMSAIVKQNIAVQQAREELLKAQSTAVPEQIEIKRKVLDRELASLQLAIQKTQFSQDLARENQDFREGGPTTQMRDRSQQAGVIAKTGEGLINDIKSQSQVLGPIMGRYGSLADFVGNPPKGYAGIASELTTFIALQPAAHGFRGLRAVQEFEKSIGTPIRTPEALIEAIQGNAKGLGPMQGVVGGWTPLHRATPNVNAGGGGPKLQKKSQSSPASSSGSGGGAARSVVRNPDGTLGFAPQAPTQ